MEIFYYQGHIHIRIRLPECVVLSHVGVLARFMTNAIMGRQLISTKWLFRSYTTRKSKDHSTTNYINFACGTKIRMAYCNIFIHT